MQITIGQLSRRTGVNIETIRYYERTRLIPKAQRGLNGRRIYGEADIRRLAFIRHARKLGFEMAAIRSLLTLQDKPDAPCTDVTGIARGQLEVIERRIEQLKSLRGELVRVVKACSGGRISNCRIIEALSQ